MAERRYADEARARELRVVVVMRQVYTRTCNVYFSSERPARLFASADSFRRICPSELLSPALCQAHLCSFLTRVFLRGPACSAADPFGCFRARHRDREVPAAQI